MYINYVSQSNLLLLFRKESICEIWLMLNWPADPEAILFIGIV
ncbi:hypothetical protein DOJK_00110 [Patescibacteria group bacterium]|nr:hypothetical protein DOJK_00110 [Patescibacteria group bacterium]